jgi:hypothetical protein
MNLPKCWLIGFAMFNFVKTLMVVTTAGILVGCSSGAGMLDGKSNVPVATNVPVGNTLALPPDLQLATPTQTSDAYQSNGAVEQAVAPVSTKPAKLKPQTKVASSNIYGDGAAAASAPVGDVFEQNGISKINPDGSPKSAAKLAEELRAIYLAKKRQKNPSYGTIANIGAIFSDQ